MVGGDIRQSAIYVALASSDSGEEIYNFALTLDDSYTVRLASQDRVIFQAYKRRYW